MRLMSRHRKPFSSRPRIVVFNVRIVAHRCQFDAVVVWKFDRFARSVSHLLRALETFNALGMAFVTLSEQMDTSTPVGKMVFTVLGAVAELERSLIAECVRAGLRNAKAKGKTLGRPRIVVDAATISRLRSQGCTIREIAEALGVSRGLVHKTLANHGRIDAAITEGLRDRSRIRKSDDLWQAGSSFAPRIFF